MRPFAPHGSILNSLWPLHIAERAVPAAARTIRTSPLRRACFLRGQQPWRPLTLDASPPNRGHASSILRRFTTTARVQDEASRKSGPQEPAKHESPAQEPSTTTAHLPPLTTQPADTTTDTASIPITEPSAASQPSLDPLPSQREKQRWDTTKHVSQWMEDLLEKLALAGQKVNNYTGTDYSGIQALREQILAQGTSLFPRAGRVYTPLTPRRSRCKSATGRHHGSQGGA